VSYREAFWLATSAAAPVIALAAVVAVPDATDIRDATGGALMDRAEENAPVFFARKLARTGTALHRAALTNLLVQAGLLAVSLTALAIGGDVVPPWVAIVLAVGGVLILAWTAMTGVALRKDLGQLRDFHSSD
jgi:hypothetical protein